MGVTITKNGNHESDTYDIISKGRAATSKLNHVKCDIKIEFSILLLKIQLCTQLINETYNLKMAKINSTQILETFEIEYLKKKNYK